MLIGVETGTNGDIESGPGLVCEWVSVLCECLNRKRQVGRGCNHRGNAEVVHSHCYVLAADLEDLRSHAHLVG